MRKYFGLTVLLVLVMVLLCAPSAFAQDASVINLTPADLVEGAGGAGWKFVSNRLDIQGGYSLYFEGTCDQYVINNGTITGGTYSGDVQNNGTISGGTYSGDVTNAGTITGGTFGAGCHLHNYGTITGTADLSICRLDDHSGNYGKNVKLPTAVMLGNLTYTDCDSSTEITLYYFADDVKTAEWTVSGQKYSYTVEGYRRTAPDADLSGIEGISHNVTVVPMDGYEITIDHPSWNRFNVAVKHSHSYSTDWKSDGENHWHECACGAKADEAAHYGGTANCTEQAVCKGCGEAYGDVDPDAHDWGEWEDDGGWVTDKTLGHRRFCKRNSGHYEEEDHTGGNPTCNEPAECTVCLNQYIDGSNHGDNETSEWIPLSYGTHHYKWCLGCGNNHTVAPHDYTIPATCTTPAACVCGATTGDALGHAPGAAATCTGDQVCTREGCGVVLTERLGHAPGAAATCTSDQVCTREGCGTVLTERFGHNYESVVVEPACTEDGYTLHTCSRCGAEHTDTLTAALNHWYGLWSPVGGEKHHADCLREGCDHDKTVACEWLEMTAEDALWRVCPVCGDCEAMRFEAIFGSKVKDVDKGAVPAWGEVIVRGADAPFDGALYAFTAAYEFAGRVQPFKGTVQFTVPLDGTVVEGCLLMRVDAEGLTEIPFVYEKDQLTFETDRTAIYLLVTK